MSRAPTNNALDSLKSIVGSAGWLSSDADTAPFNNDFRGLYRGRAALILRPDTVKQVQEIVALCAQQSIAIVPQGGNTSYCGGATPNTNGQEILLCLSRLSRVRTVDPDNNTMTLDAGCTLQRAREVAHAAQRHFPLSLGSEGSCQVGGNLSTNAGGTAVLRYGMMRDLVLGLEVVLPDGSLLNQLKGLRKDNTGYDVKQLFLGAEGTLGIITGACLKLFPKADDYVTALVAVNDIGQAVSLLSHLRNVFGDIVERFEYLPDIAHQLTLKHIAGVVNPFSTRYPALVLLELAAPRPWTELSRHVEDFLSQQAEQNHILNASIAKSLSERDAFWFMREHIPEAQTREGVSIKHDVSLPISALQTFISRATTQIAVITPNARIIGYGHVGDGNLHFNLSPAADVIRGSTEEKDFLARASLITATIHDLVAELGGSFSAEHGIGQLKVNELERYEDPTALALMRRIKAAIDPHDLMNPGKVIRARPDKD
jgi:FAD/FMN-containing dehydrogenase